MRADVPNLTAPVAERSTLAALISRWIFPSEWRYSRPTNSSLQTIAICASVKTPGLSWTSSASDPDHSFASTAISQFDAEGQ